MLNRTGFDCVDNLIGNAENRTVTEACHNGLTAVDTGHFVIFFIAAQFDGFFDYGSEVLVVVNVNEFRIRNDFRCEYAIRVGGANGHKAVRREEESCGNVGKFLLLILPSRTEIALKMFVFFQFGIAVSRQHFTVCINVDAFAFRLF